jgi:malate dehydrogenase
VTTCSKLAKAVSKNAPDARTLVISSPVNSTVPIVAKVLQQTGTLDACKVFGVTTLDVVYASSFLSSTVGTNPKNTNVTVVDGHSGVTIVPLLFANTRLHPPSSQANSTRRSCIVSSTAATKSSGQKDDAGCATLSMAAAAARCTLSLLRALNGKKGVTVPTFVKSPLFEKEGIEFFSSNVELRARSPFHQLS